MSHSLEEIAAQLSTVTTVTRTEPVTTREVTESKPVPKVQLIYAFNGSGKTRLSRKFKELIAPKTQDENVEVDPRSKVLYYNAFTEDLFYWDNDLEGDLRRVLKIQPNAYTSWVLEEQGKDQIAIGHFQRYTNEKLTPRFNEEYTFQDDEGKDIRVPAFSEVTFSYKRGNEEVNEHIKISKGEESNFIWSIFYSLIEQVVSVLNVAEPSDRETDKYDLLEYIVIDDPVSSLDDNHLIELAVDIAELIKSSSYADGRGLRFIITTHSPLFYNVLCNEFGSDDRNSGWKSKHFQKYRLEKQEDESFNLEAQPNDSPFSYHLFLKSELDKVSESGEVKKYHFNFLRNILEKTSTFVGNKRWEELLPPTDEAVPNPYYKRILNISSHSKHAGEEVRDITEDDIRVFRFLVQKLNEMFLLRMRNE
jgi:wobble nucleotide-excising tRNase